MHIRNMFHGMPEQRGFVFELVAFHPARQLTTELQHMHTCVTQYSHAASSWCHGAVVQSSLLSLSINLHVTNLCM